VRIPDSRGRLPNSGPEVGRITPAGKATEFSTGITAGSDLAGIAAGADGDMWFTQVSGDQVGRISPTGKVTEFSTGITAGSDLDAIAAGADGNMWFTQDGSDQVGRITTGVPSAPRRVTASPRDKAAVVSWVAPARAGAAAITRYTVTATPGRHTCKTTGKRSCTVTGLKPHTSYRFRVTARNRYGTGPVSTPSRAITVRV
jgi:hypothetical protein